MALCGCRPQDADVGIVTPGFRGRRRAGVELPPGQYLVEDFPVLSAGPTPRVDVDSWQFTVITETGEQHHWSWADMLALPQESPTVDIHCVTKWSKLATSWRGVAIDTFLADIETAADYALVSSYGGDTPKPPPAGLGARPARRGPPPCRRPPAP